MGKYYVTSLYTHTRAHVIIEQIYLAKKKKQIQPLPIKIISRYYIIPVKDNK